MTTLIERAACVVRDSLHRSWHAREMGAERYALPDHGVRMVMSDLGMAAYDIWRTAADQRAIGSSYRWTNTIDTLYPRATLAKLRASCQRMLGNHRSIAGLAACPPSELRRIAQDVGLSVTDLRSLGCSHPGPAQLMSWRLQQLGIDPAYVKVAQTATYRDLERVCGACNAWRRCTHDLAKGDVQAGMRGYCLNAFTIDALTVDRPSAS
jgi:hypothetical protein